MIGEGWASGIFNKVVRSTCDGRVTGTGAIVQSATDAGSISAHGVVRTAADRSMAGGSLDQIISSTTDRAAQAAFAKTVSASATDRGVLGKCISLMDRPAANRIANAV